MNAQHSNPGLSVDAARATVYTTRAALPVPSAVLLQGNKTVGISHNGMLYTLQATKLGKLILTK